ncbi:hypothetical protein H6G27_26505 [Nostoc linckia FACHB-104]|nr:hypothetical protein [Nostoc linckia FACHB-104]
MQRFRRQTIEGTLVNLEEQQQPTQDYLPTNVWAQSMNKVSISSEREYRDNIRRKRVNERVSYDNLIQYAQEFQRAHRLEEYVAYKLRLLGLNAIALPAKADGNTKTKAIDIVITTGSGQQLALEVKEARHKCTSLGLPVTDGNDGFESYPEQLYIDACYSYDAKEIACERKSQILLGAIVLCPIARLSDAEFTTLGAVYCPVDQWQIKTTQRGQKVYSVYVADRSQMFTLNDLVAEVNEYV